MVRAATDAPVSASISTPVRWWTAVTHSTMSASELAGAIAMSQRSRPSGWQNGMSSCVRFAAIVPATIAVWNTGPFAVLKPEAARASNASRGKRTTAAARATRRVGDFALTSTMAGAPSAPTCESLFASSANVVHLDLARPRVPCGLFAQFAVAVVSLPPHGADVPAELVDACARAQDRAEVRSCRREQAGVEDAFRGQPCAGAAATERLRHRRNEADLARAVRIPVPLGDFPGLGRRQWHERPACCDRVPYRARRHDQPGPPVVAVADVHVLDEADHHARPAEVAREVLHLSVIDAALDDRIDLDRREARLGSGTDAVQHAVEAVKAAVHPAESGGIDRVQADGHARESLGRQLRGVLGEQDAVGGEREVLDPVDARELSHEVGKPGAQERLSAGETDLADAFGRERARQPLNLVEGQALGGGQEPIALAEGLARHAIWAAEIAAVHDGDAQVEQRPSAQVDGRARRFDGH